MNKKDWWEDHECTKWWNNLSLDERQTKAYHYCTMKEIGVFELTMDDILNIWNTEMNSI